MHSFHNGQRKNHSKINENRKQTRMWANAQCDGHPDEYRWRPLSNAAKIDWRPLLKCQAVMLQNAKPTEISWGAPNSRSDLSRSWAEVHHVVRGRYCCLTSFFPIIDMCLSREDIAWQSCAMVPRWRIFASCISSEPRAAHFRLAS